MIVDVLSFNPRRDVAEVAQIGYIDLNAAFRDHVIPSVVDDTSLEYGVIDSPDAVLNRATDVFEAMHIQQSIHDYTPKESNNAE